MTEIMGGEGLTWFIGEVVSTNSDTLKLGRVKIRAYHWHDYLQEDQLPHAQLMTPPTSASIRGLGVSPTGMQVGSRVIGFFADGRGGQHPIIMGSFHIIEDGKEDLHAVSQLARGKDITEKAEQDKRGPEDPPAYKSEYPHNKTFTTESGHAVEFDDTPGHERIHIYHKAGTYIEIDEGGKLTSHCEGNAIEFDLQNKKVTVNGDYGLVVYGNHTTTVYGDYIQSVKGKYLVSSGETIEHNSVGAIKQTAGGSVSVTSPAGMTINQGSLHINGGFSCATGKDGYFQAGGVRVDFCGGIITNAARGIT